MNQKDLWDASKKSEAFKYLYMNGNTLDYMKWKGWTLSFGSFTYWNSYSIMIDNTMNDGEFEFKERKN